MMDCIILHGYINSEVILYADINSVVIFMLTKQKTQQTKERSYDAPFPKHIKCPRVCRKARGKANMEEEPPNRKVLQNTVGAVSIALLKSKVRYIFICKKGMLVRW